MLVRAAELGQRGAFHLAHPERCCLQALVALPGQAQEHDPLISRFALHQPGLFRTAFSNTRPVVGDSDKAKTGASGLNPFQLLSRALDLMVLHRLLPARRRASAEYLAWSAVHGLAFLVIDGPLHTATPGEIATLSERLILMVEKGLTV